MLRHLVLLTLGCAAFASEDARPPNIFFAPADDWSCPHPTAYGVNRVKTPHFDRVAAAANSAPAPGWAANRPTRLTAFPATGPTIGATVRPHFPIGPILNKRPCLDCERWSA